MTACVLILIIGNVMQKGICEVLAANVSSQVTACVLKLIIVNVIQKGICEVLAATESSKRTALKQ